MNIKKNQIYNTKIISVTHDGNGVCKIDNFTIFVPNTAVGDILDIKIVKVLKSYGFGIVENIITPSESRVDVDCEAFNQCGGCVYRHISYESELDLKWLVVKDSFSRIGGFSMDPMPIIKSDFSEYYRNKTQYPVGYSSDNKLTYGFYAKRSHRIISCDTCYLQPIEFDKIAKLIMEFMKENKILGYDERLKKGIIRHIYIRKATTTKEIMVCIVVTKKEIDNLDLLISKLTSKHKNITSIFLNINDKDTNVILGDEYVNIYGQSYITDKICDIDVRISPDSFYQVNKLQAQKLYLKAVEYAGVLDKKTDDVLLDLYCGIGTIGLIAAANVKKVVGIEIVNSAVKNATDNSRLNNIENAEFICSDANNFVDCLNERNINPNIIVVDPPRKGLDEDTLQGILKVFPEKLVMISCNPATAARDCKVLCENGYELVEFMPYDLFPRTFHVESVVLMSRVDK